MFHVPVQSHQDSHRDQFEQTAESTRGRVPSNSMPSPRGTSTRHRSAICTELVSGRLHLHKEMGDSYQQWSRGAKKSEDCCRLDGLLRKEMATADSQQSLSRTMIPERRRDESKRRTVERTVEWKGKVQRAQKSETQLTKGFKLNEFSSQNS
jgi:hypothetical protein